jgi:2-dehydro-3-deoxygalactonokinase
MQQDWAAAELAGGELRLRLGDELLAVPCGDDPAGALCTLLLPRLSLGQAVTVVATGWPGVAPIAVPCPIPRPTTLRPDPRISLCALPGLMQDRPGDLIQTQVLLVAGHLAEDPDFDGILCLPGRQTAWAQVSAKEIVSFRSFLTAEMLSALSPDPEAAVTAGFDDAVSQAMSRPAALAAEISSVRAGLALGRLDGPQAADRLAGLLIGAELAAARPWWLGQNVVVMADGWLADRYLRALAAQGVAVAQADPAQALRSVIRTVLSPS